MHSAHWYGNLQICLVISNRDQVSSQRIHYINRFRLLLSFIVKARRTFISPVMTFNIFDLFPETAERNWTKLKWTQVSNVLDDICVLGADQNKAMVALISDKLLYLWLPRSSATTVRNFLKPGRSQYSTSCTKSVFNANRKDNFGTPSFTKMEIGDTKIWF